MKAISFMAGCLAVVLVTGCEDSSRSGRAFLLPNGDPKEGKQAFVGLGCNHCHKVEGSVMPPPPTPFHIKLGGKGIRDRSDAYIAASIINPSHAFSADYQSLKTGATTSPMPSRNRVMTVEQMVNIAAFLETGDQPPGETRYTFKR